MLERETAAGIILDFQRERLPSIVKRELKINLNIPLKRAIVVMGPRRSGKTYYLYYLIKRLLEKGIRKEQILYINFEDPRFINISIKDLMLLMDVFFELYPENKRRKIWLFFDEIQDISGWETFIRGILDREKASVFISGSSSKLLSKEIATSLRGRTLNYLLLPFSFTEFLEARGFPLKKYFSSQEKAKFRNLFTEYFSYGGYPEAVIYPQERKKILQEIIEVTIYRDIVERYKIRNIRVIKILFNYLINAKEFSVHKFFNFLKSLNIKVSKNSLYNYLEYFNDAFIFFPLRKFSYSIKEIEQSIPKIYTIDNGLIEIILRNNKSKKFENLVFLTLLRKGFEPNKNIFYYAFPNGEVDFVIKEGRRITSLIQASYHISDYTTKEREINSLIRAAHNLKCKNLSIITHDYESEEKYNNYKIKFIPILKWWIVNK